MSHNGAAIAELRRKISVVSAAQSKLNSAISRFNNEMTTLKTYGASYDTSEWIGQKRDKYNESFESSTSSYRSHITQEINNSTRMSHQIILWEEEIARLEAEDSDDDD